MKKTLISFFVFLTVCLSANAQGYGDYKKLIENFNLYPFKLPDKNFGPATIIKIKPVFLGGGDAGESLMVTGTTAFPHVKYAKDSKYNDASYNKIANTTISIDVKANTASIIPAKLLLGLSFDLANDKTVTLTMTNPVIQEVQVYDVDTAIMHCSDETILNYLIQKHVVIIGRALQSTGYAFTFKRNHKLTVGTLDTLNAKVDTVSFKISVAPNDSTTFTLSSKDTLYYGYSPCQINTTQVFERLSDLQQLKKIKDSITFIQQKIAQMTVQKDQFDMEGLKNQQTTLTEKVKQDTSKMNSTDVNNNKLTIVALNMDAGTSDQVLNSIREKQQHYIQLNSQVKQLNRRIQDLEKQQNELLNKKYSFVTPVDSVALIQNLYQEANTM